MTSPPFPASASSRWHALARVFVALALACALTSLLSLGGSAIPALDLASHFRVQYLAGLVPAIVVALLLRLRICAIVLLGIALVHGTTVVRAAWPMPKETPGLAARADALPMRIVTSNLLTLTVDHAEQVSWLADVDPDVVVFQEYTPAWHDTLSNALDDLPYRHAVPLDSAVGIALYSRWPIVDRATPIFGRGWSPSVTATLDVDGTRVEIVGTHPLPPLDGSMSTTNLGHVRDLAAHAADLSGPVVVAGDLNLTPWSHAFRTLVREGGLHDARRGHGVLATWSPVAGTSVAAALARSPLSSLPIDHVLVRGGIAVDAVSVGAATGSDHRGFVADVRVPREPTRAARRGSARRSAPAAPPSTSP